MCTKIINISKIRRITCSDSLFACIFVHKKLIESPSSGCCQTRTSRTEKIFSSIKIYKINLGCSTMHESFIGKRIAELLVVKQLSAEQVSEDLGQSKVYIDKIIANEILPSMNMFFAICNRLEISPVEFFTE